MKTLIGRSLAFALVIAVAGPSVAADRSGLPRGAEAAGDPGPAPVLPGTVIKVRDGDTLRVRLDSGPIEVRIFGADAPERDQNYHQPATKLMRSLVEKKGVALEVVEQKDRYDRLVARVFAGDTDVGAAMIDKGYAWAYRDYLGQVAGAERYCDLEAQARVARRGLWADPPRIWEPPWIVRARKRGEPVASRDYATETAAVCRAAIRREAQPASGNPARDVSTPGGAECLIKGNLNNKGERIYHMPGDADYPVTEIDSHRGERWFCTEEEARAAGWRRTRH